MQYYYYFCKQCLQNLFYIMMHEKPACTTCFHKKHTEKRTHSTEVDCLCTAQKASHMWRAGDRLSLMFSQAVLKLHKLIGTLLPDLLDDWA